MKNPWFACISPTLPLITLPWCRSVHYDLLLAAILKEKNEHEHFYSTCSPRGLLHWYFVRATWVPCTGLPADIPVSTPTGKWWPGLKVCTKVALRWWNSFCWSVSDINNTLSEAVPEHPRAGVSSMSSTSSGYASLPSGRPPPPLPGCTAGSPWTEQSGHSGCSVTGQLQQKEVEMLKPRSTLGLDIFMMFPAAVTRVKGVRSVLIFYIWETLFICKNPDKMLFLLNQRGVVWKNPSLVEKKLVTI